jgi:hypothetical protein
LYSTSRFDHHHVCYFASNFDGTFTFDFSVVIIDDASNLTHILFPQQAVPASVAAVTIATILEHVLVRPLGYKTPTVHDFAPMQQTHALLPIWFKSESEYDTTLPSLNTTLLKDIALTSFLTAFIGTFYQCGRLPNGSQNLTFIFVHLSQCRSFRKSFDDANYRRANVRLPAIFRL